MEVVAGDIREIVELHALRSLGQGPPSFHIGLGDVEEIDLLRITWPDGEVIEGSGFPVNRVLTAVHSIEP